MRYVLAAAAALCLSSGVSAAAVIADFSVDFAGNDHVFYVPTPAADHARYTLSWTFEQGPAEGEIFYVAFQTAFFFEGYDPLGEYFAEYVDGLWTGVDMTTRTGALTHVLPENYNSFQDGKLVFRQENYLLGVQVAGDAVKSTGKIHFVLTQYAVPEPGTWAMLIVGFGFVGAAVRRRRIASPS